MSLPGRVLVCKGDVHDSMRRDDPAVCVRKPMSSQYQNGGGHDEHWDSPESVCPFSRISGLRDGAVIFGSVDLVRGAVSLFSKISARNISLLTSVPS